jgi:hypothetical protein
MSMPLTVKETSRAALKFVNEQLGERPVVAVISQRLLYAAGRVSARYNRRVAASDLRTGARWFR